MSLPKEPRQKMINIMYLVLTALLALNVSSEILNAFKVVDKSLQNSTQNIELGNSTLYSSLKEKLSDPASREKAAIWEPKAEQSKKLSDDMFAYIEGIKKDIKTEAGSKLVDGKESYKEDDLEAATRYFEKDNRGELFKQKLEGYRNAMLNIDPTIKAAFEKTLPIDVSIPVKSDGTSAADFATGYFHMTPAVAALTLLSKFQNNVKNSENQVTTFCHEQIGKVKVVFDKAAVLVGQSSNYVMPGQEIEVTAGVGSFSSQSSPKISINGSGASVENGIAKAKFQATGAGNHSVPITVTYVDQNNLSHTESKTIEYTVGTPGGAAVMLDKMNVFYIGVDNPITISSGSGWDKTSVSMSGGSLSQSNGKGTVRVSSPGTASITVTADGKPSKFDFRVKEIPNPVFKVGPGGTRMQSVAFKNQQFCRAELENFDFDAKFNVVSANVYFSGAGFGSVQIGSINGNSLTNISSNMQKCQPGSAVTFDAVKVQGPDGRVRSIQGVGIVLY